MAKDFYVEKLPSGTYRAKKMVNGKRISVTFDHKPTYREYVLAVEEKLKEKENAITNITFEKAAEQYINVKKNVLSEASIREYSRTSSRLPKWFTTLYISEIDQVMLQKLVNEMATTLSPKTVKDRHAFAVGVIRLFYPDVNFSTTLPRKVAKIGSDEVYIPSHEDVRRILEYSKDGRYYIPLRLACYGLRREEICALTKADLSDDNLLTINKALVQDQNNNWIIKETKTAESTRIIAIDATLADQIRQLDTERIFVGFPQSIANYLSRTQNKLGIRHFSLHKLRHYFCSTLAENNIPESDILAAGGWKQNSDVMKKIYRHSNLEKDKERLYNVANVIDTSF